MKHWLIGLGILTALLGIFLIFGEKPWEALEEIAERETAGRKARVENFMAIGFWWAALANLVLALLLMTGVKLWARRPSSSEAPGPSCPGAGRWVWIGLGLIVVLGGALRWNFAGKSLWWDELWSAKFAIVGYYLGKPDMPREERRFGEASWKRALWYYSKPTNHGIASFNARMSHLAWRKFAQPEAPHAISDLAIRLPTFLVSLVTIFLTGWLGVLWRRPWTGLLAALLLAIHPWHIRYGIDVRAYSYLILWTITGCLLLTRIFQEKGNRWSWWTLFGLNQFLIVWSFPVAAFLALGFFAAAVVLVLGRWNDRANRITALARLVFVNVLAVMMWLPMFAPNVPQIRAFMKSDSARHVGHEVNTRYLQEFASRVTTGLPYRWGKANQSDDLPDLISRTESGLHWWIAGLIGVGMILGVVALGRKPREALVILSGLIGGALVTLLFFKISNGYFYPRFLIFMLIPAVWLLAAGWVFAFSWGKTNLRWIGPALLFAVFTWLAAPQIRLLATRPYEPLREIAEVFSEARANDGNLLVVGYGHGVETLPVYYPEIHKAVSKAELEAFITKAREANARLLLTIGHDTFNRHVVPDGFALLDDPAVFEEIATFSGIEPLFRYRVMEWKGD